MEFRFWKKAPNSAPNASRQNAEKATSAASSSMNTEPVNASVSPELEAEVNAALRDVEIRGADHMMSTFKDAIEGLVTQIAGFCNNTRGQKIVEVLTSNKANDHVIIAFGDGSAISVKFTASTVRELDEAEGKR